MHHVRPFGPRGGRRFGLNEAFAFRMPVAYSKNTQYDVHSMIARHFVFIDGFNATMHFPVVL